MRAVEISQRGLEAPSTIVDIAPPSPQYGQVLIKNFYAGLSFQDLKARQSDLATQFPIPGREGIGEIVGVGEGVPQNLVGQWGAYFVNQGSLAEFSVADLSQTYHFAPGVDMEVGAHLAVHGVWAHYLINDFFQLGPSVKVLIHSMAGATGLILAQWAQHLGAEVIGTVSTPEKKSFLNALGFEHVVLRASEDLRSAVQEFTEGQGVDVVYDSLGIEPWKDTEAILAPGAHFISLGSTQASPQSIDPQALAAKSIRLAGAALGPVAFRSHSYKSRAHETHKLAKQQSLVFKSEHIFELSQLDEAYQVLASGRNIGKILIKLG